MDINLNDNKRRSNIEKLVIGSNEYETYWHFYNYRMYYEKFKYPVPLEPGFHKDILIELLETSDKNESQIKNLLNNTPRIMTPFSHVHWFYKNDRVSLWLKIICNIFKDDLAPIDHKNDIRIFTHNLIYNLNIDIKNNEIEFIPLVLHERKLDSITALGRLEKIYRASKIDQRTVAFLRDSKKVDHAYNYIKDKIPVIPALRYAQDINFEKTSDKLNYILAILDYWNFEKVWNSNRVTQIIDSNDEKKKVVETREAFIDKIRDACNSKGSRDRKKKIEKTGLELTEQNKKNLRYLAKDRGKTQHEVLNDLVKIAHQQTRYHEIDLTASFRNDDTFFDNIPQAQPSSLQSEHDEKKVVFVETSLVKDKEGLIRSNASEPVRSSSEYALSNTVTPSQNNNSFTPFRPEQAMDVESSADYNTKFIADKVAGKLR